MPRLKTPAPRIGAVAPRLKRASDSPAAKKYRTWYSTARWKRLRKQIIRRDNAICQQTGVLLIGREPEPNSPVVDHIRPHRGDPDLFWSPSNLQAVSKAWHDRVKQGMERRGEI